MPIRVDKTLKVCYYYCIGMKISIKKQKPPPKAPARQCSGMASEDRPLAEKNQNQK